MLASASHLYHSTINSCPWASKRSARADADAHQHAPPPCRTWAVPNYLRRSRGVRCPI